MLPNLTPQQAEPLFALQQFLNNNNATWSAGVTSLSNLTREEFQQQSAQHHIHNMDEVPALTAKAKEKHKATLTPHPLDAFDWRPSPQQLRPGLLSFDPTSISTSKSINDLLEIKQHLRVKGPLVATFDVYSDIQHYAKGVYVPHGELLGTRQSVAVVGYSDADQAWLVKSNWGKDWGQDGYCLFGYGECRIDEVMHTIPPVNSDTTPHVTWYGLIDHCGLGAVPVVAINDEAMINVHRNQSGPRMYAANGFFDTWFEPAVEFDKGYSPSVAMNGTGAILSVHESDRTSRLFYNFGQANTDGIKWISTDRYDNGKDPSVAIDDYQNFVEIHRSETYMSLYYTTGFINSDNAWQVTEHEYLDSGLSPVVAMNNKGQVIEVHQNDKAEDCYYRIGQLSNGHITWQKAQFLDYGIFPSVAINDHGQVVACHQSAGEIQMYVQIGTIQPGGATINFTGSVPFGQGYYPKVALNNQAQLAVIYQNHLQLEVLMLRGFAVFA